MKKLLTVFGIALVAMVLAVGCKNGDSWGDVDKKTTEIKLTDGDWEYESSGSSKMLASNCGVMYGIDFSKLDGFIESEEEYSMTFTVSNGKVTMTSEKGSNSTTFPSGADTTPIQAEVTIYSATAEEGEDYSFSGSTAKYKYETPENKLQKDIPVDDFIDNYLDFYGTFYKNEDGTKYRYYSKRSDGVQNSEAETTLVKQ